MMLYPKHVHQGILSYSVVTSCMLEIQDIVVLHLFSYCLCQFNPVACFSLQPLHMKL